MFRRWLICLGVPALALATALYSASPASAQRWGRFGGGYYGNSFYGPGYGYYGTNYGLGNTGNYVANQALGTGYYGNPYYGGYYNNYNNSGLFGNRLYSSGYGSGWNSGYYSPWSNNYNSYAMQGNGMYGQGYTSFYAGNNMGMSSNTGINPNAALIDVRLPADAELWFDRDKTSQSGGFRQFVTPALNQSADNTYTVTALWLQNGEAVQQTRQIHVHPGARVMVDFFSPSGQRSALAEQNMNQGYTSFYAGQDQNIPQGAALINVRVPGNAELWIGDQKTNQTGSMREFVTPALRDGQRGTYTLHAKWTGQDGRQIDQTRKVQVQPGAHVMVDFFRQSPEHMQQNPQNPERVRPGEEGTNLNNQNLPRENPAPAPAPARNPNVNQPRNQPQP